LSWAPTHGYAIYTLTTAGRARFRAEAPLWHRHAEAIAVALRRTSADLA
jgi:DNA-binding PadR family transcriptional regulator